MYMASLTPLVNQLGSRSNICVSSSLMWWLGLSLLICFDTSEEEELGLLCSAKRALSACLLISQYGEVCQQVN